MTRREALRTGATKYQGKPCPYGHSGVRYTSRGSCVECTLISSKEYKQNNKRAFLDSTYKSKWKARGMEFPTYDMPEKCECCGRKESRMRNSKRTRLSADHCHPTGNFRGWICNKCNVGIGKLGDDLIGVQNAIRYLLRKK